MKWLTSLAIISLLAPPGFTQYSPYQANVTTQQTIIIAVPVNGYIYSVGDEEREKRIIQIAVEQARREAATPPKQAQPGKGDFKLFGGSTALPTAELGERVRLVLQANCASCHRAGSARPGIQLFAADGKLYSAPEQAAERSRRTAVYEAVRVGAMPKNGTRLAEADIALIREWSTK